MNLLEEIVRQNRAGKPVAIASVCSAHPDVLTASMQLASERGTHLLVEATSNQVNQFGGYTGLDPAGFIRTVHQLCDAQSVDRAQVIFGGDHLGPQAWRSEDAELAMNNAKVMMRQYIEAGFSKIHLDCSEGCRGEPSQVGDDLAADRAAQLAAICEAAAGNASAPNYVVGTEVPPPGGARGAEEEHSILLTTKDRAQATLSRHKSAFSRLGLEDAFERVIGLVVQPGVEFGPDHVDVFDIASPNLLADALASYPKIAFEAHSTDYQPDAVFVELARRHFAILKVGPALTFAYRQAMYSLDAILAYSQPPSNRRKLPEVLEEFMLEQPKHWQSHYMGSDETRRLLRHFGYADRIRYYWTVPQVASLVEAIEAQFNALNIPTPMLLQFFSPSVLDRAEKLRASGCTPAKALIHSEIQSALDPYFAVSIGK
jgi:D-tagatose-bisphosphate aldolase class II non-catalytic subunit